MSAAIERFEQHLLIDRGCKRSSVEVTMRWLRKLHDLDDSITDVTRSKMARRYRERAATTAAATHQNELRATKDFWRWLARSGYISSSPAEGVEPIGRKRRGKPQLRLSEAQRFFRLVIERARKGKDSAIAALAVLVLGLRASEILQRRVRDVDVSPGSVLLWIDEGKTESSSRHLELPSPLDELMVDRVAGRAPGDWLFPQRRQNQPHPRSWLLRAIYGLCKDAGVPRVCVHGLRGTCATLTTEAGYTAHVVAHQLGHAGPAVTRRHYIQPGSEDRARARAMLRVLDGGKAGEETRSFVTHGGEMQNTASDGQIEQSGKT